MNKGLILATVSSAALLFSCLSAAALEANYKATSKSSVDAVWTKIGNFCGIASWHPALASCDLSADGKERTLTLKGGGTIVEDLVKWNDKGHNYTYKIKSSPLPVADYISTITVMKHGHGSEIVWVGHFKAKGAPAAKAKDTITGIYKAGVDSLAQ